MKAKWSGQIISGVFAVLGTLTVAAHAQTPEPPPAWAYPIAPKEYVPPVDDGSVRHVPGSNVGFTLTQIRDLFFARDWFPDKHAAMPAVVSTGRQPNMRPCGVCHRPEGIGGPENASLAGLSTDYIIRQIEDYRSGARTTGLKERAHVFRMIASLKELTPAEIKDVAAYFSAMKLERRIKVVEASSVPTSYVPNWYYTPKLDGTSEPLGDRIIEMPDDEENFVNRDSRVTFTAYVPPGSIARGAALVRGAEADRITACAACHGEGLKGNGDFPPLVGRSPSLIVRQLYEFKYGMRHGSMAEPMIENTKKMTVADMVAIAAYLANQAP